jgi:hypothetical protein
VNIEELGNALVSFFDGDLKLVPKIATRPWTDVCIQIENELQTAIDSK